MMHIRADHGPQPEQYHGKRVLICEDDPRVGMCVASGCVSQKHEGDERSAAHGDVHEQAQADEHGDDVRAAV